MGVPPPSYREIGASAGSDVSRQTIADAQDLIGAFLHGQRQHVATSNLAYHRQCLSSPDIDIYYTNHNGAEKIEFDAHPQEAAIAEAIEEVDEETGVTDEVPDIEQPQQQQPQIPPDTLCLMVLFGTDGIAAFSMDNLGSNSPGALSWKGTSASSNWGSAVMPIGQYKLGGTEWILTPTDFVGGTASTKMRLSTTKLTDQVATQASSGAVPVANGGSTIFTVGGKFALSTNPLTHAVSITQTGSMATDGGVVVQPTAIDTDGTSYFFPEIIGMDVTIQIDPGSTYSGYGHSAAFDALVSTQQQGLQKSIPNPLITTVSYLDTSTVFYPTEGSPSPESIDATGECMIVTYGTFVHLAFQNGTSYYGKGSFGEVPTPQNVQLSQSARTYEVFDIGVNHTDLQTTPAGVPDFSNIFPLQTYVYDASATNDTLAVGEPNISASSTQTQPITLNTDKDGVSLIGSTFGVTGLTYTGGGSTYSNRTVNVGFSNNYEVTYPAFTGSTAEDARNFYSTCQGVASAAPNILATNVIEMVEFFQDNDPPASITAQWATKEDSPFPDDCIYGFVTVDGVTSSGASSYNHPFSWGNITSVLTRYTSISAFGRSLTFTYTQEGEDGSGTTTTTTPPSMSVHAFPPAFAPTSGVAKAYFNSNELNTSNQIQTTCYTPYGTYAQAAGSVTEPFKYWMHVSNAKHVLQGYLINGVPYAFLDGSTATSFLDTVATACGVAKAQIKGIFMDIQLSTIQGLTNVQSASYSSTPSGEPAGGGLPSE